MEPQGYASAQALDDFFLEVFCVRDYSHRVHHSSGTDLVGPGREGCCCSWLPSAPFCYWEAVWVAELVDDCSLPSPPLPPELAPGEGWALVRAPLGMADTLEPLTMASDSYWCSCTFLQPAVFLDNHRNINY